MTPTTEPIPRKPKKRRVDLHVTVHLTRWEKRWVFLATACTFALLLSQIISHGHI